MQEYPKALYFGTMQAHQHKVVNGVEHESELRELGFVDFADLFTKASEMEKLNSKKNSTINTESENIKSSDGYEKMTSEQLRVILSSKGIKYLARDSKVKLLALLNTI